MVRRDKDCWFSYASISEQERELIKQRKFGGKKL